MRLARRPARRDGPARRAMSRVGAHAFRNAALLVVLAAFAGALANQIVPELVPDFGGDAPALRATGSYAWVPEDAILFAFARPFDASQQARVLALRSQAVTTVLPGMGGVQFGQPIWRGPRNETSTRIEVVAERHGSSTATIIGMHAVITKRAPPLAGAQVLIEPQGDGKVSHVAIDLDTPEAIARTEGPRETLGRSYFLDRRVTVSQDDPATFVVQAYTHRRYYEWKLAIVVTVNGQTQTLCATDHGHPFQSTAGASTYSATYRFDPTHQRFEHIHS
jgi:hypothetical protein